MTTSVFRPFFAALAAVFILSACGGGQEEATSPTSGFEQAMTAEVSAGLSEKEAKAPVAKPAAVQSSASGHKASAAAPQAAVVAPYVSFAVGNGKEALSLAAATVPVAPTAESFMDWAESSFAELFPGGHQVTMVREGFVFRYYPAGDSYLAVTNDGKVYVWFPPNPLKYVAYMCEIVNVETCRPQVVSASVLPKNGAVDVPLTGTVITVPFDRPVVCPQGPIAGTFGVVAGTMTCTTTATTATVTITVTGELPENFYITATLNGFRGIEGYEMPSYSWSFTTAKKPVVVPPVPMVRVVTANFYGYQVGDAGASIINPANRATTQVVLDTEPGGGCLRPGAVNVDNQKGIAYVGAGSCNVLHRVDVKTGVALPSFYIDTRYTGTGILGIAHSTKTGVVCIATGWWGKQATTPFLRNRFICFNPVTGEKVFDSQNDFLGDATLIPTKVLYSATYGKFYVVMATEAGLYRQVLNGYMSRDSYKPDTSGFVVEIDTVTYTKGRTWNVGSMPMDAELLGNTLYVVNAGSKSLSKIDLSVVNTASAVTTVSWWGVFPELANPTNIKIDLEKGVYYLSDWFESVRVMSLGTDEKNHRVADQQIGRIVVGGAPRGLGIAGGSLWVALAEKGTFGQSDWALTISESVLEIDRTLLTVRNTLPSVGKRPFAIATYDNIQP